MKRSFEKEKTLRPFRCDIDSLEFFINQLLENFEGGEATSRISFRMKGEELSFENVNEMRSYLEELPATLTNFSLRIFDWSVSNGRSCHIFTGWNGVVISATSDNLAWSAGVVEIARDFSDRHSRWYSKLSLWHIWLLAMIFSTNFLWLEAVGLDELSIYASGSLYLVAIILWYIFFRFENAIPPFVLVINRKETWVNRYSTELIVGATIFGAVAAISSAVISIFRT